LRYSKLNSVEDSIRAGYMSVFPILSCRKSFTYEEEIKKEKEELAKKAEENKNRAFVNQAPPPPPRVNRWEFPSMNIHDVYENPIEENGPMVQADRGGLFDIGLNFVLESEVDI
jgi:Icc-related predicted phosphoesterase